MSAHRNDSDLRNVTRASAHRVDSLALETYGQGSDPVGQRRSGHVGRGLFTPMRYQDFVQFQQQHHDPRTNQVNLSSHRVEPAVFWGRMPTQCRVTQSVAEWTPQLNRLLTIPIEPLQPPADFDWNEVPDFETSAGQQPAPLLDQQVLSSLRLEFQSGSGSRDGCGRRSAQRKNDTAPRASGSVYKTQRSVYARRRPPPGR